MSASTDGLVTLFDPSIADEDDAVIDVLNNTAAVSHALLTAATTAAETVLAISHDERLARHEVADEASRTAGDADMATDADADADAAATRPEPIDLRERYGCDYAVGLREWGGRAVLVVGASKT